MSTLTTNFVPQPAVYRGVVDRSLKKSRTAKDIPLPEVPKVIDNGNGKRYFRGRLLGKVSIALRRYNDFLFKLKRRYFYKKGREIFRAAFAILA